MLSLILLFFVVASIIGTITVMRQIIGNQKHLDEDTIRKFKIKRLSEKEHRRVTTHLGICEKCQELFISHGEDRPIEDHLIHPDDEN